MRYATRNGLIISPYELGYLEPTEQQFNTRRRVTTHHGYWTGTSYHSNRLHTIFRNLVTNTYPLLVEEHQELHEDYSAPPKPNDFLMQDVIEEYLATNGVIDCIYEKRTRQTHQITPDQWQNIRGGYGLQTMVSARESQLSI